MSNILFENEFLRFSEITVAGSKNFELTIMSRVLNDMLEKMLAEKYDIEHDYVSFDDLNNKSRTTHHYNATLDFKKMIAALHEFTAAELSEVPVTSEAFKDR